MPSYNRIPNQISSARARTEAPEAEAGRVGNSEESRANQLRRAIESPIFPPDKENLRRSCFRDFAPGAMYKIVSEEVLPFLGELRGDGSTYSHHMKDARFTGAEAGGTLEL